MTVSLDILPQEILHAILCYCDPLSSVALERTSRRFGGVTNEPILWRFYCQAHFQYWDSRHDMIDKLSRPISTVDWKALFVARYLMDHAASKSFDGILQTQTGRIRTSGSIVALGYDVKDTLLRNIRADPTAHDYLARRFVTCDLSCWIIINACLVGVKRYYAETLLTCLHRSIAISEWAKIRNGEIVPLDRALGAFDLFIPEIGQGSLDEVCVLPRGVRHGLIVPR